MSQATGGRKTFDLSTNRSTEDDYELVQFADNVGRIIVERSDSEAYLHFGTPQSEGYSTHKYGAHTLVGRTGDIYLENADDATGDLVLTYGSGLEPELGGVPGSHSTITGDNASTFPAVEQADLDGDSQFLEFFLSTQDLCSVEVRDSGDNVVWEVTLAGGQSFVPPEPIRIPEGGDINPTSSNATSNFTVGYLYQ